MKTMKLASKLMFVIMAVVAILLFAAFGFLYLDGQQSDLKNAHFSAEALASQSAAEIENRMLPALHSARALAAELGGFQDYPVELRRDVANSMIKEMTEANPDILGAWAAFEPNALDGLDAQYAGQLGHGMDGSFDSYWVWENGTVARVMIAGESRPNDYYQSAFASGQEKVLEPYVDRDTGESITMTSFAVPIRDNNGILVGVAGVDLSLAQLEALEFEKGDYETAGFALLSNAGTFLVHTDAAMTGTNLAESALGKAGAEQMLRAIKAGENFVVESDTALTGGVPSLITFTPVHLGDTDTPWSVEVAIAQREVMAESTKDALVMIAAFVLTLLAVFAAIGISVRQIINRRLRQLVEIAGRQAQGDFSEAIKTPYADELGMLFRSLGDVNDNMNGLLANLRSAAEQVDSGARQISDSSVALAQGATEQASSIEELTASMEQISAQTQVNADNAAAANHLADKAKEDAESGNGQMEKLLAAMEEINASSKGISGIIKVIDDIAFQTNILSLNAAVEAARAGEHGKGFAVVAEEVRSLAAKSAQAAGEITRMIEESISKVSAGGRIADETARVLKKIVEEVESAAKLVSDISVASGEQAAGIAQINQGILQVSQVVQSNSATAQQAAAASEELSGQAENLMSQAAQFKLREDAESAGFDLRA